MFFSLFSLCSRDEAMLVIDEGSRCTEDEAIRLRKQLYLRQAVSMRALARRSLSQEKTQPTVQFHEPQAIVQFHEPQAIVQFHEPGTRLSTIVEAKTKLYH
jgi:hypothetical protein